ncbi:Protein disulfide-isomerase tmx3 [Cichlidogyrus casuarinus]|uniref:Protein disulfide-isomerase tmx3 n=1 Tax=Cichlidogyrus casuarinus TaxID=1844966 RepID=A0ABD2QBQ3_9PLAT
MDDLTKMQPMLVMFYAPWCGHCKKVGEIYEDVANELGKDGILTAALDATQYRSIADKYSIAGYPTIKFIHGDKIVEFNQERTFSEMVSFARRVNGYFYSLIF